MHMYKIIMYQDMEYLKNHTQALKWHGWSPAAPEKKKQW